MYFNFKIIRLLLCASLYANWNSNCCCCFNWQISWLQTQVRPKSDPKIHQLTQKQTTNFPVPNQTQVRLKISELSLILGMTRIHLKSDPSQNQVRLKISELSLILGMTRIHLKSDPSHSQIFLTWLWEQIVSENLIRLKSDSDSASYMGV